MKTPATEHTWFYEMSADGYSLDDKRTKLEGFGDLSDIVTKYHKRNAKKDTDRTAKCFIVPRADIEAQDYDFSLSRYKKEVFAEVSYEKPSVILERLLKNEAGDAEEKDLKKIKGGIVKELLELREMIG